MRHFSWGAAAVLSAATCASTSAGTGLGFSSDTASGSVTSFAWDGGDAGGFGTAGTLKAAMHYAADQGAGTNFDSAGFLNTEVNVFLVDFRGNPTYDDAGLTAFVMWGTGVGIGGGVEDFFAEVDVSPRVNEGADGSYTDGLSEIYAIGPGVTIEVGGLTVDVEVSEDSRPVVYAITNITNYPGGRINEAWTLAGDIITLGLYGFGEGRVWEGVDTDGNPAIFTDEMTLIVPSPAGGTIVLAALGMAGFIPRRRRR